MPLNREQRRQRAERLMRDALQLDVSTQQIPYALQLDVSSGVTT